MIVRWALALGAIGVVASAFYFAFSFGEAPLPEPESGIASLSSDELLRLYEESEARYLGILATSTIHDALAALEHDSLSDEAASYFCHDLAHALGQAAYEKYQDFGKLIEEQNGLCVSGYMHGVMEGLFGSVTDVVAAAAELSNTCDPLLLGGFYDYWECYHGIGHGIMFFTKNELPDSIALCERFPELAARDGCTNGAYMEHFNGGANGHVSPYLSDDDMFAPCATQKNEYKYGCYMNAPIHYLNKTGNDFAGSLEWCDGAELLYREACYYGVGGQTFRRNPLDLPFAEDLCSRAGIFRESCVTGIASMYISFHDARSSAEGYALCDAFAEDNQEACRTYVDTHVWGMEGV